MRHAGRALDERDVARAQDGALALEPVSVPGVGEEPRRLRGLPELLREPAHGRADLRFGRRADVLARRPLELREVEDRAREHADLRGRHPELAALLPPRLHVVDSAREAARTRRQGARRVERAVVVHADEHRETVVHEHFLLLQVGSASRTAARGRASRVYAASRPFRDCEPITDHYRRPGPGVWRQSPALRGASPQRGPGRRRPH